MGKVPAGAGAPNHRPGPCGTPAGASGFRPAVRGSGSSGLGGRRAGPLAGRCCARGSQGWGCSRGAAGAHPGCYGPQRAGWRRRTRMSSQTQLETGTARVQERLGAGQPLQPPVHTVCPAGWLLARPAVGTGPSAGWPQLPRSGIAVLQAGGRHRKCVAADSRHLRAGQEWECSLVGAGGTRGGLPWWAAVWRPPVMGRWQRKGSPWSPQGARAGRSTSWYGCCGPRRRASRSGGRP